MAIFHCRMGRSKEGGQIFVLPKYLERLVSYTALTVWGSHTPLLLLGKRNIIFIFSIYFTFFLNKLKNNFTNLFLLYNGKIMYIWFKCKLNITYKMKNFVFYLISYYSMPYMQLFYKPTTTILYLTKICFKKRPSFPIYRRYNILSVVYMCLSDSWGQILI